ncbi:MAG: hypothetical protein HC888_01755 [Candidatus Competibacteraceae bacterium]|nr:hypothetical protein [Candidatus Competibacteraceae bacterium]
MASTLIDVKNDTDNIPDIITFVEDPKYLGIRKTRDRPGLYPLQRIALKAFYRGSRGNEHLTLDNEEREYLKRHGFDKDENGNIIKKFDSDAVFFNELMLIWGRRCLSEDCTLIDPSDGGLYSFGELWDSGRRTIDSWTFDESNGRMIRVKDAEIIFQGEREVFKLVTKSGHEIEATDNHPFLTPDGWKLLKDLVPDKDTIAICEDIPFFGDSNAISEDEAAILGYMTGDGNCSQNATFFTCANDEVLRDFEARLNRISDNLILFNDPWTKAASSKYQYKITSKNYVGDSYFCPERTRKFSRRAKNDLVKLLIKWDLMGKTCHQKTVPLDLFKCPKNVIAAYLKALFSCDGSIGKRNGVTISFSTVNEEQINIVRDLLSKFGIQSIKRSRKTKTRIVDEKGETRLYTCKNYELYFSKKNSVRRFF